MALRPHSHRCILIIFQEKMSLKNKAKSGNNVFTFSQAVEKVFSQQSFLSLSEFLPVKTAKKER